MKLVDRMIAALRLVPGARTVESTKDELAQAVAEREERIQRTDRLAAILADYRAQDGALRSRMKGQGRSR